jgi:hypothetical protein
MPRKNRGKPTVMDSRKEFHSGPRRPTKSRTKGSAHFGGTFEGFDFPGYAAVYVAAARAVFDAGVAGAKREFDHLARPCIYLQRHALELMIKDLRDLALAILESRDAVDTEREYKPPKPTHGHDLVKLVAAATTAVAQAGWTFPDEISRLARELAALEQGDETRLRYAKGARGDFENQRSFSHAVNVPVEDWQRRLEAINRSLTPRMSVKEGEETFLGEMAMELHCLTQRLAALGLYD